MRLHLLGFEPVISLLGTDEQIKKWLPDIEKLTIVGNYAQTELGHGNSFGYCISSQIIHKYHTFHE